MSALYQTTDTLLEALHFAAQKHRDQRRKDQNASPYINHPIAVAYTLSAIGGVTDSVTLIAAVLHDTIEDTETTPQELSQLFGSEVAHLVEEITDDTALPKERRKQLQIERARNLSEKAKLIRLADKICNVRDVTHSPPAHWPVERRMAYLDWTEAVVRGCKGVNAALDLQYEKVLSAGRMLLKEASPVGSQQS
jgi:guanosine-3',5'-bis(diphosphate) 3'-pyrophosphohydrolase